MRHTSVLVQIFLLIGGILLFYMYIYPEIFNINDNQDLIEQYNRAIEEASDLRADVQRLQQRADSIPSADLQSLERYLPTTSIDQVMVQRDLLAFARSRSLILTSLVASDESTITTSNSELQQVDFTVSVQGDYDDIKAFIADTERNNYPLRLASVTFSPVDSIIEATMVFEKYSFIGLVDNER